MPSHVTVIASPGEEDEAFMSEVEAAVRETLRANTDQLLGLIKQNVRRVHQAEIARLQKDGQKLFAQAPEKAHHPNSNPDAQEPEPLSIVPNTRIASSPHGTQSLTGVKSAKSDAQSPSAKSSHLTIEGSHSASLDMDFSSSQSGLLCTFSGEDSMRSVASHSAKQKFRETLRQRKGTKEMNGTRTLIPFLNKADKVPKSIFADAGNMKEHVRKALSKKEYNVCDYYRETGPYQRIARSPWFEYITLSIIAFNALWIAVDADMNDAITLADAHPIFQIAAHGFCLYFSWEWLMRFLSFEVKFNGLRDFWFVFDTALVIMMIGETWIVELILVAGGSGVGSMDMSVVKSVRLARLTRMGRLARLLRAVPELIILIKGIGVASRSVCFTLTLLFIFIYLFAIVFRQLLDGTDAGAQYFNSVPEAMISLLLDAVLPDQSAIVRDCANESAIFGLLVLLFILIASLTVMNMLVGVLVEVVSVVSSVEKEQLTVNYVKEKMFEIHATSDWDTDGNNSFCKEECYKLLMMPTATKMINDIGVDVVGLIDFVDFIFMEGKELSFGEFMELLLTFRGSNMATVKDVVDMRKFMHYELTSMKQSLVQQLGEVITVTRDIKDANGKLSLNQSSTTAQGYLQSPSLLDAESRTGSMTSIVGPAKESLGKATTPFAEHESATESTAIAQFGGERVRNKESAEQNEHRVPAARHSTTSEEIDSLCNEFDVG